MGQGHRAIPQLLELQVAKYMHTQGLVRRPDRREIQERPSTLQERRIYVLFKSTLAGNWSINCHPGPRVRCRWDDVK